MVSELARNILLYAERGSLELTVLRTPRAGIRIVARDKGPGIASVHEILDGNYRSPTGLGLGLRGSKRMVDQFNIATARNRGTVVTAVKFC